MNWGATGRAHAGARGLGERRAALAALHNTREVAGSVAVDQLPAALQRKVRKEVRHVDVLPAAKSMARGGLAVTPKVSE